VSSVSKSKNVEDFKKHIAEMIIVYLFYSIFEKIRADVNAKICQDFNRKFKGILHKALVQQDNQAFGKKTPKEVLQAINSGIEEIRCFTLDQIVTPFQAFFRLAVILIILARLSFEVTLAIFVLALAKIVIKIYKNKVKGELSANYNQKYSTFSDKFSQCFQNVFCLLKDTDVEEIIQGEKELSKLQQEAINVPVKCSFLEEMIDRSVQIILIGFSGYMTIQGVLPATEVANFNMHYLNFSASTSALIDGYRPMINSLNKYKRLFEIIDYEINLAHKKFNSQSNWKRLIQFKGCFFCYLYQTIIVSKINATCAGAHCHDNGCVLNKILSFVKTQIGYVHIVKNIILNLSSFLMSFPTLTLKGLQFLSLVLIPEQEEGQNFGTTSEEKPAMKYKQFDSVEKVPMSFQSETYSGVDFLRDQIAKFNQSDDTVKVARSFSRAKTVSIFNMKDENKLSKACYTCCCRN